MSSQHDQTPKRAHNQVEPDKGKQGVTFDDLDDILSDVRNSITGDLTDSISTKLSETFSTAIKRVQAKNEARFSDVETKLVSHDERFDKHEKAIEELRQGLVQAESSTPDRSFVDSRWERQPDPATLEVSCNSMVAKPEVEKSLEQWLSKDVKKGDYSVVGNELGKFWRIVFKGAQGLGAPRAAKCFANLKGPTGWNDPATIKLTVPAPDNEAKNIDLFINPDRSDKEKAEGACIRRMLKVCRAVHTYKTFKPLRDAAAVSWDMVPFVRFICKPKGHTELKWNPDAIANLELDKPSLQSKFEGASKRPSIDDVQWV